MIYVTVLILLIPYMSSKRDVYHIGYLISDAALQADIKDAITRINHNPMSYGIDSDAAFNYSTSLLSSDIVQSTTDICDKLIPNELYVVISTNPTNSTKSPTIVSYACAFYKIPVITLEARESEYTDKTLHPTTLRMVPSYTDQARVLAALIKNWKWNKVNVIATNDYDGRMTYIKFTTWAYKNSVIIEKVVMVETKSTNVKKFITQLNETQSKVIVLISSNEDAINIYQASEELKIIQSGYIWLTTQQAVEGEALQHAPTGIISLRLTDNKLSTLIKDATQISAKAINRLRSEGKLKPPPSSCNEKAGLWETGDILYKTLLNISNKISFDWYGDRSNATYEVVNVQLNSSKSKSLVTVGQINDNVNIILNETNIKWLGNETRKPSGSFISNHLKIVTVVSKPFVYATSMHPSGNCSNKNELNAKGKYINFIPCRGNGNETYCCKGYCMELLIKLAERVKFTYDLHLVGDGQFGSLKKAKGSNIKRWNGMVGEIIEGKADLSVASLTIINERAQYIEFSKPFKYLGITVLVKKQVEKSDLASFFSPFKVELWILVLVSVHVVAVILYLLDRFSPFGRYRLSQSNKDETPLDLASAMWFSWGVLLNSGIGEGTPRSFSARVLGMVWAGFAMIIVASYTANLAAFLVLDRADPIVKGIDDPQLRNPSEDFPYATVANSSVDAYFRRQVELSNMYTFMEKHNVKTEDMGIRMVKNGSLKAFIWDSPVLFHETSNDCDVITVGDLFGRSGYGIGMPKGSPWSNDISLSILHFHESGAMEELESTWIDFGSCDKTQSTGTTLGLQHMLGVFIMVAGGIGAGIVIVILEVLYYKHKGWRKQQQKVLKKTTEQWQEHVQDRKNVRQNGDNNSLPSSTSNKLLLFRKSIKELPELESNNHNNHNGIPNPTFENAETTHISYK